MHSIGTPLMWAGFNVAVVVLLLVDLLVFNRKAHEVRLREAAFWSAVWISLSLGFNVWLFIEFGKDVASQFLTGYVVEESLSVDNLFVFLLVLSHFKVPKENQHRVLFWGVIGAQIMRAIFILLGAALVARFHWVLYFFGAFLVFTAYKLLRGGDDDEQDVENNSILKVVRKFVPMTSSYEGSHFFVKRDGKHLATPLLAVLVVIETSDIMFAVDSIPAVFGVTLDPYIAYTSNICAILGLRSLFFLVMGVLAMLRYLKTGLAFVLGFVGVKMLISHWYEIPGPQSLAVIGGVLAVTVVASVVAEKREKKA